MRTIWMTLRSEMRARRRSWVALALVFGLGSGAAIAAAAGARRTDTAYPRFVEATNAFDALSGGGGGSDFAERFAALKTHPSVEDFVQLVTIGAEMTIPSTRGRAERVVGFPEILIGTEPSGRAMYEINRAKILEGRLPEPTRVDQVSIPFTVADRYKIEVGDRLVLGIGYDLTDPGAGGFPAPLEQLPVSVVGIHASAGDFESIGQTLFLVNYVPPAVFEKYKTILPQPGGDRPIDEFAPDVFSLGMKLTGGPANAAAFKQAVERTLGMDVPIIEPVIRSGVQKTVRLYVVALWLLSALIAIATLAIVGQTIARQQALESADYATLRAVGVSRRQLVGLGLLRAAVMGLGSAVVSTVFAYLLSPLTPIGPARIAEPAAGLAFDATALGIGCALIVLLVPLITLVPSLRAAYAAGLAERVGADRPSWLVRQATRTSVAPATATGLRMALEPGRGKTAVPVRSTIIAVALGVAAVTASVTVGHSLTHLVATPALTGFTYDAILPADYELPTPEQAAAFDAERFAKLREIPFVDRVSRGTALNVVMGGTDSFLLALEEEGEIGYALIEGRAPSDAPRRGLPEIALGPATMRRMGLKLGGTVAFEYAPPRQELEEGIARESPTQRAVIVGIAAIPPLPWAVTDPGEGGVMSAGSVERFGLGDPPGCCFVSFKPGTDLREAAAALDKDGFETSPRTKRADMATLERISELPAILSAIFAVIAAAALAHVLVTAVRRRRRDLAILKTLGFVQRQVRAAIAWQVSTIAVLSLIVGIPLGIVIGRWGWRLVAAQFGVVPVPVAPIAIIALLLPAALVLGNLVAALPGRSAARTQPALVLRTE